MDASNGDFVVVVIQYRLNVFGFLSGEEVKQEGVLNAGLCTSFDSLMLPCLLSC